MVVTCLLPLASGSVTLQSITSQKFLIGPQSRVPNRCNLASWQSACRKERSSTADSFKRLINHGQSQWLRGLRRRSVAVRLLGLRVRILPGHGCLSLVSVVCCQVEVSASGWSLVQRSLPSVVYLNECDRESSIMRITVQTSVQRRSKMLESPLKYRVYFLPQFSLTFSGGLFWSSPWSRVS
jgi:hypothetical protein